MEANRITTPFKHRALEIVVKHDTRYPGKRLERRDVSAQEILHPGIEAEAQEDLPRVAQHHHERHQRTPRPPNLQVTEMSPVGLGLFTGQAAQPQITRLSQLAGQNPISCLLYTS